MGKNSDGEALQKTVNKLLDVRNLKDLHLKLYHTSSAQFKKRPTHLDIPWKGLKPRTTCGEDVLILQKNEAKT